MKFLESFCDDLKRNFFGEKTLQFINRIPREPKKCNTCVEIGFFRLFTSNTAIGFIHT